jgi:hypothetical protein
MTWLVPIGLQLYKVFKLVFNEIHVVFKVFIFGGLGPLHSDVSLAGVAKAFGVRLVRLITFSFCKNGFLQYFFISDLFPYKFPSIILFGVFSAFFVL